MGKIISKEEIKDRIAYCGLLCALCDYGKTCNCKTGNHCGKRLSPAGCFQYECCKKNNLNGCWECDKAPCGKDMRSRQKRN
ncbi:MAG: hypothetical protein ACRC0V_01285 [Fusobacteriaceae bacterium]